MKTYQIKELNNHFESEIIVNNEKKIVKHVLLEEEIGFENEKIKILKPSINRIKPECKDFYSCGGCQMQHMNYDTEALYKTNYIKSLVDKNSISTLVLDIIKAKNPFNYRNKMHYVLQNKGNKIVAGFYEESSKKIVQSNSCLIHNEIGNKIIVELVDLIKKQHISVYDTQKDEGIIKDILIKTNKRNEALLILITTQEVFPGRKNLITSLINKVPEIKTVVQNINPRKTNVLLGEVERVIYGKGFIIDEIDGIKFKISSKTFYQINPNQTEILYKKAIELAKIKNTDVVLDAYSGIGTISLLASRYAKKVIGVELVKESVQNAINNAKDNNIRNAYFFASDVPDFLTSNNETYDIAFVDPPRKGLDEKAIQSLIDKKIKKIVYISCNPESLFRDLNQLRHDYEIKQIQPVDMFPFTYHVENVVCLNLKK